MASDRPRKSGKGAEHNAKNGLGQGSKAKAHSPLRAVMDHAGLSQGQLAVSAGLSKKTVRRALGRSVAPRTRQRIRRAVVAETDVLISTLDLFPPKRRGSKSSKGSARLVEPEEPPLPSGPSIKKASRPPPGEASRSRLVFMSYARPKRRGRNGGVRESPIVELLEFLEPLRTKGFEFWFDTQALKPGAAVDPKIAAAIAAAHAAIVMLDPQAVRPTSYVMRHEWPFIRARVRREELRLIWLLDQVCLYDEDEFDRLHSVQDPSTPIRAMKPVQRNQLWKKVATALLDGDPPKIAKRA